LHPHLIHASADCRLHSSQRTNSVANPKILNLGEQQI